MRVKVFKSNTDPKNTYDPYNEWIKDMAKLYPFRRCLLTNNKPLVGVSATELPTGVPPHTHHIFPRMLFPLNSQPKLPNNTQTILVSQKRHEKLHKLLAQCKIHEYVVMLRKENPNIPSGIITNLYRRIRDLPEPNS